MPTVVGVRFKDSGKTYHFDPGDVPLMVGDWAVVETARGPELGRVAQSNHPLEADDVLGELRPVLRRAADTDWENLRHYQQYVEDALQLCIERIREHRLPMHMLKAEYNFDGSRLTFFFTADKRVDFRLLVRDLARTFHTRIELRQVGPRDEAKLLGGMGPCGRPLCCSTFLPEFAQVSIKMAKDQDLPLNPTKVSGVCGRLLCCLAYEQEQYLEIKAELPPKGAWVQTPDGPGEVVTVNVVRETVTVQLQNGTTGDFSAAQISAVTEQVGGEARRRNKEGITPAVYERGDGERIDPETLRALAVLEDRPNPDTMRPPRSLRPEATLTPSGERGRLGRALPGDARRSASEAPRRPTGPPRPAPNQGRTEARLPAQGRPPADSEKASDGRPSTQRGPHAAPTDDRPQLTGASVARQANAEREPAPRDPEQAPPARDGRPLLSQRKPPRDRPKTAPQSSAPPAPTSSTLPTPPVAARRTAPTARPAADATPPPRHKRRNPRDQ